MMKRTIVLLMAAVTLMLAGDRINGAGASFPAKAYFKWIENYNKATGSKVFYQAIGSGGGIKQMKYRTVDFGGTDAPLKPKTQERYRILQFPSLIGGIVLAYNIEGIGDNQLKLSNEAIEGIFFGEITSWADPIITKDNPDLKLPDEEITVVHRSDSSGTTFGFTDYMTTISQRWAEQVGKAKSVAWPTGEGSKGSSGVSNMLKQIPYSIGYVTISHKIKENFTSAMVQSSTGAWVSPAPATIANAAAFARWKARDGFYISLVSQPGDQTYPITTATFVMMHSSKPEVARKVTKFFDWAFNNGDEIASELGFVPLPIITKDKVRKYWEKNGVHYSQAEDKPEQAQN